MKKKINGIVCDTDVAKYVSGWDNGKNNCSDPEFEDSSIWRTQDGHYFLYVWGINDSDDSGTIVSMTPEEARAMVTIHDTFGYDMAFSGEEPMDRTAARMLARNVENRKKTARRVKR